MQTRISKNSDRSEVINRAGEVVPNISLIEDRNIIVEQAPIPQNTGPSQQGDEAPIPQNPGPSQGDEVS